MRMIAEANTVTGMAHTCSNVLAEVVMVSSTGQGCRVLVLFAHPGHPLYVTRFAFVKSGSVGKVANRV